MMSSRGSWVAFTVICGIFAVLGLVQLITSVLFYETDAISDTVLQPVLKSVKFDASSVGNRTRVVAVLFIVSGVFNLIIGAVGLVIGVKKIQNTLDKSTILIIFCVLVALVFVLQLVAIGFCYRLIDQFGGSTVRTNMQSSLTANFASSKFDSSNQISNSFNYLFYQYRCCGVNAVSTQTTGFENSLWCNTSGSDCQTGTSKIPNICCIGTTPATASTASTTCKANLNNGTYYTTGCYDAYVSDVHPSLISVAVPGTISVLIQIAVVILVLMHVLRGSSEKSNEKGPETVALR